MIAIWWKTDTENLMQINQLKIRYSENKGGSNIIEFLSFTGLTWPSRARILLPDRRSHTRATASNPHVATKDPSWWKQIPYTLLLWPSWRSNSKPVSISHNLQVLSKLVVAKYFPNGWKEIRARRSKWPPNVLRSDPSVFHNIAVRSADAVAKWLFMGENETSVARSVCPFKFNTFFKIHRE